MPEQASPRAFRGFGHCGVTLICRCQRRCSHGIQDLILIADVSWLSINQVQEGDSVWAADPETGEAGPRAVVGLIQGTGSKALVQVTINGDTLTATAGHPFWSASRGAWIDASDIRIGERLLQDDGDEVIVEAVDRFTLVESVYNFEVAGLHTYFVEVDGEGVLVHNCKVPVPNAPGTMTSSEFGSKVMKWGSGHDAARARMKTLTADELTSAGVTKEMAFEWRAFYRNEMVRNPDNPSAAGRADLMDYAWRLLA